MAPAELVDRILDETAYAYELRGPRLAQARATAAILGETIFQRFPWAHHDCGGASTFTLPIQAVNDVRIAKFKQQITDTLAEGGLEQFQSLIEDYEQEHNIPAVEIAAALAKLARGDVPLLLDLAKSPEDAQLMRLIFGTTATGYPSFMGPKVAADRVDAIRQAFRDTMKDPDFRGALARQKLEVDPIEGEDIAKMVTQLLDLASSFNVGDLLYFNGKQVGVRKCKP